MLVSSHHLSQRGTRKEAPKQGRRREKSKPEREREREQEQLPEMKPGQPASRGRKHKSTGGFAYSEVERRTHTTVQEGPAQLSTSEKRGRGTEEEVGPVAAAAAAFPSSRGSPHHAPAAAIAARTVFRVPVPSLSRRQHTSSSSLQVVLRYACSFTCSCLLVEMLVCAAEVAGPPLGAERPKMEHSLATIHHFLFRRQHLEPVLVFRLVLARQLLI